MIQMIIDMIKYNNSNINDWNFGDDNIIKVYRNNAVCYYKVNYSGDTPTQVPCYAVVDDISQYSDTEFEDVFNKADEKWYKLNNLNQYEEYGVYGSGRTSCEGSTSRLPQGYTEVEYIRNSNYNAYINTSVIPYDNTSNRFTVTARVSSEYHSNLACATIIACEEVNRPYYGFGYRYKCSAQQNVLEFFGADGTVSKTSASTSGDTVTLTFDKTANSTKTMNVPLYIFGACENSSYTSATRYSDSALYSMTVVKNNEKVRDFVPAKRDSDDKYGLYDLITDSFFTSPNGNNFSGGEPITPDCVTTYEGKLTIDDGYEYLYSGSSWNNVGEVSGSSRLPQGYTEVEYIETDKTQYIDTGIYLNTSNFEVGYTIVGNSSCWGYCHQNVADGTWIGVESVIAWYGRWSSNTTYKVDMSSYLTSGTNTIVYKQNGVTINGSTVSKSLIIGSDSIANKPLLFFGRYDFYKGGVEWQNNFKAKSLYIKNTSELVRDFVPAKRDSDGEYGMYDLVTNTFYTSPNGNSFSGGAETGETVYPVYYTELQDPPNNLSFSSMTEAEEYECPWVGMKATINGDKYVFSGDSQSGYEWVEVLEPTYYTLQELEDSHTTTVGSCNISMTPTVSGITKIRLYVPNASTSTNCSYLDINSDSTQSNLFAISTLATGQFYRSVQGYNSVKAAADDSNCQWAYWVDASTMEIDILIFANSTGYIANHQVNFSKTFISFSFE